VVVPEWTGNRERPRLDPATLADLNRRLLHTRVIHSEDSGWERGTPARWISELIRDWSNFDPAILQDWLDELTHVQVTIAGVRIHAVVASGAPGESIPLLLTHGWPGSFLEFLPLIPLLVDPTSYGADPADCFTIVAPSLPGFGFSGTPPIGGLTHDQVAEMFHELMTAVLGFPRYVAHGTDLGAGITARLARAHPESVMAIHLATPGILAPPQPWGPETQRYFAEVDEWTAEEGGYAHIQSTKPSTLGIALDDSPVAHAAWIGEKCWSWSSVGPDGRPAFDKDLLLATLTLFWATQTGSSSLLPYWANRHDPPPAFPADRPVETPTSIDIFGGEVVPFPKPPRELAERYFTIAHWHEHDRGGHFPAVAEPELLAQRLRECFRPCRGPG
jgi:pimeloyl-ACP methyl ester carboxylesterase